MRLLTAATIATMAFTAAIAAPSTMMGPQSMMRAAKTMSGGMFIIHHAVADYAKWRVAYDADQPNRVAAGLANCQVHRSLDDANDIVIACGMSDLAKARTFASSKPLADTMAKAGVVGKPQFLFLAPPQ